MTVDALGYICQVRWIVRLTYYEYQQTEVVAILVIGYDLCYLIFIESYGTFLIQTF